MDEVQRQLTSLEQRLALLEQEVARLRAADPQPPPLETAALTDHGAPSRDGTQLSIVAAAPLVQTSETPPPPTWPETAPVAAAGSNAAEPSEAAALLAEPAAPVEASEPPASAETSESPAAPKSESTVVTDTIQLGIVRLDERFAEAGEYRHLDISVFDAWMKEDHWARIRFKFANFEGKSYLEFRIGPDWPEVFRVWPGDDEDSIGRRVRIPHPKTAAVPEFGDPLDREIVKGLFKYLDLVVGIVTMSLDAPKEEIELWRNEARALAALTLPLLETQ